MVILLLTFILSCSFLVRQKFPSVAGVPLKGDYAAFVKKMQRKGFELSEDRDGVATFSGAFMGRPDASVTAVSGEDGNVAAAGVFMDGGMEWQGLNRLFFDVVGVLKDEYGEPAELVTKFAGEGQIDPNMRVAALIRGECDYHASWTVGDGLVETSLEFVKPGFFVVIRYLSSVPGR